MIDSREILVEGSGQRPRIVVVGAGGRLGKALCDRYRSEGEVMALDRRAMDLRQRAEIARCLDIRASDVVVMTAGLTAVDYCESHAEEAYDVNAEAPREVARICAERGARLVFFSTDFVFDGSKSGAYSEDDAACPISIYGASKRRGEEHVLEASANNLVVRVSWLFGAARPAFPEWIIGQALEHGTLALPGEKTGSPTCCEDLAEYLLPLLGLNGLPAASGVVHLCNSGSCTWQEWGQFCVDAAVEAGLEVKARRVGANRMEDIPAFVARRPLSSVLDNGKYRRLTGMAPRDWREALREHLRNSSLLSAAGRTR